MRTITKRLGKLPNKSDGDRVAEFAGRHNIREADTMDQMASMVKGLLGKRLRYRDLVSSDG